MANIRMTAFLEWATGEAYPKASCGVNSDEDYDSRQRTERDVR
jgi:hypothetical protein